MAARFGRPVEDRRDGELIELAASGDRDAFDVLIRPRLDRLYRMAFAITHAEADARDATQDACVLAWRELPRLRDRDKFDAWLSQILVNAARGVVRKAGRTRVREVRVEPDPGDDRPPPADHPATARRIRHIRRQRRHPACVPPAGRTDAGVARPPLRGRDTAR